MECFGHTVVFLALLISIVIILCSNYVTDTLYRHTGGLEIASTKSNVSGHILRVTFTKGVQKNVVYVVLGEINFEQDKPKKCTVTVCN